MSLRLMAAAMAVLAMAIMAASGRADQPSRPATSPAHSPSPFIREAEFRHSQEAQWRIPLPPGTRVIELPAVSTTARLQHFVRMKADLVIGAEGSDPRASFYRPSGIAVDDAGSMYVADAGNHRVQVFDRAGRFIRSLGRRGQGPGEFESPRLLAIADGRLLVWDPGKKRFVTWVPDGSVGPELSTRSVIVPNEVATTDANMLIILHGSLAQRASVSRETRPSLTNLVQAFDLNGELGRVFLELEGRFPKTPWSPFPAHAVDRRGIVYVSTADEYQILAVDAATGVAKWALRVDMARRSTQEGFIRTRELVERANPDLTAATIARFGAALNAPDREDAIRKLWVDGHGHLYVDIDVSREELEAAGADRAIDVYSENGERLFSGFLTGGGWEASLDNYVYGFGTDAATMERTLVRFSLEEPFE